MTEVRAGSPQGRHVRSHHELRRSSHAAVTDSRRIALVGAGHIAETHARAIAEVGSRAEFVAVAEIDPGARESFARRHEIPGRYGELATLIDAEAPELVIVCTPPGLHFDQILSCLAAGVWVHCGKAGGRFAGRARRDRGR